MNSKRSRGACGWGFGGLGGLGCRVLRFRRSGILGVGLGFRAEDLGVWGSGVKD